MFCDQTIAALKTHPISNEIDTTETVHFIEQVLQFWNIVGVKKAHGGMKKNDPLKKSDIRFR